MAMLLAQEISMVKIILAGATGPRPSILDGALLAEADHVYDALDTDKDGILTARHNSRRAIALRVRWPHCCCL